MKKTRISSRLAAKQSKELTKQSIWLIILSIIIGLIFFGLVLPNAVRLFFEILDKNTVIDQDLDLPPQSPVAVAPPEYTNQKHLVVSGYAQMDTQVGMKFNEAEQDAVAVDDQGAFSFEIDLVEGENLLELYAINDKNLESSRSFYVVVFDSQPPAIKLGHPENEQHFELKENQTISIEGETEPHAKLLINTRLVTANDEGLFSYRYYLNEGENKIQIKATDRAGNSNEIELKVYFRY